MRIPLLISAALWLSLLPVRAEAPPPAMPAVVGEPICTGENARDCGVSKQDFKRARAAFERALKVKTTRPQEALSAFTLAMHLVPRNAQYVSVRELFVQQLVYDHIQRGNELLSQGDKAAAATEFRNALELDPGNQFASQRLRDAADAPLPAPPVFGEPQSDAQETLLRPKPGEQTLHLSTDTRGAYTTIGAAFGIKVTFDDSTRTTDIHLDLDQVTFQQAMNAVALVTHTFWVPVSAGEVLIAADDAAKRKEFERWLLRTVYLPEISSSQELNDIANSLRTLFDLRNLTQSFKDGTLTMRGPAPAVLAATQFLHKLREGRPQIMIDFDVYQVTRQMLRDVGIGVPTQFTVFRLAQPEVTTTIQGTTPIAALLSQAQQQNSVVLPLPNSVISFGGGKTQMGGQIPPATAQFSQNDSRVVSLSKVTMRGSHGSATTFRLGTRYPVITSLFDSGTASLGTLPQVTYEDLGVTVKVTPAVHKRDVTLDLEMEMSSLGSQLFNGIPTIDSRRYSGAITVPNDEPAVLAGSLSRSEVKSLQGIPGIASLPLLGTIASTRNTTVGEDELLVIITPHIIARAQDSAGTDLVLPRN